MQRTKLGISAGVLGAAIYLTGLFSGYLTAVILVGYVLLVENNEWLRKNAVKAIMLMIIFSMASMVLNLIPDALGCIEKALYIFRIDFNERLLTGLVSILTGILDICEKILFLILGIKAVHQGTVSIPGVDRFINSYVR